MIISLSGEAGTGKDTAAEYLINNYGFSRVAFADELKQMCSKAFNLPMELFEDRRLKDAPFMEMVTLNAEHVFSIIDHIRQYIQVDAGIDEAIIAKHLGMQFKSPRHLLQYVGTDIARADIKDSIWVDIVIAKLKAQGNFVVTDSRFANERNILKDLGANLVRVKRPNIILSASGHSSESDLGKDSDYDYVLENSNSINDLHNSINNIYLQLGDH